MTGHIFLEGEIGRAEDFAPVSVKSVRADIAQYPGATDWIIHMNSGGGDVYEGYAIGNILRGLKKTVCQIGASCCSIATYDAECCDEIIMSPHGDFMIHLPTGTMQGNSDDFTRAASQLDRITSELIDMYMPRILKKGVLTRDQVAAMVSKETSMSPAEALQYGFVDSVQEKLKAVAKININALENMEAKDTITKKEAEGFFDKILKKLDNLTKIKNAVQIALADGTMATSDAATTDALVGSTLTGADGAPLADGPYETADGYQITIAGGKVTAYEPLMADNKDASDETAKLKEQVAALTQQLAAKSGEAVEAVKAVKTAEDNFKATFSALKKEIEELKGKTFGDASAPDADPTFKDKGKPEQKIQDPMAELGNSWITSRPGGFLNNK